VSARGRAEEPAEAGTSNYLLLLGAFSISTVGDWLYRLALPLLVLRMTGSALGTAAVYALEYGPYVVFSLVGGVAADRFDRRRLMVSCDLVSAVAVGLLGALVWSGTQQVWMVYVGAFFLGSIRPFYHPAFQSLIPTLLPDRQLPRANARVQMAESALGFLGPVLGGSAVLALGITTSLFLDSVSFVLSASAIVSIRILRPAVRRVKTRILDDLRAGYEYLKRDRVILSGSVVMAFSNVGLYAIEANFVFYLVGLRKMDVVAVGIVLGAQGVGSVIGAMLAPRVGSRVQAGPLVIGCLIGAGLATAILIPARSLPVIALAWGLVGVFTMVVIVTWFTLRQRTIPSELFGRVVGFSRMLAFATIPVASLAGGALLGLTRSAGVLAAASAVVQVGVAVIGWFTALRTAGAPAHGPEPRPAGEPAASGG
jgi:Na+/melibiose symporter-like transporter